MSRLRVVVWTILLGVIFCPAAIAFTASDLANGWTHYRAYGAVLTIWERPSSTQTSRIVGYEIWRDLDIRDVILRDENEFQGGYWIDASEPPGIKVVDLSVDPVTGVVSIDRDFIPWQPDEEGNPTWEEFLNDNQDILGVDWTLSSIHYGLVPEGPVIGRLQIYRIRPIILFQYQVAAGVYQWGLTWGELSTTANWVIPVGPPLPVSADVNGTTATFEFDSSFGTDEVIIQVARDPGPVGYITSYFMPEQTYSYVQSVPGDARVTVAVDLAQVPGSGNIFWWRVGSRNRRSTYQPRPWPPTPTDYGWVWSDPQWLTVGSFSDASPGHWAFLEVETLCQAGIVQGYPDGTYRPSYPVTRDSMAVYIARAMADGDANVPPGPAEPTFPDVSTDFWACKYVEYAVTNDVVCGYPDGLYHPEGAVDRAQMAVFVARARGWVNLDEDMTIALELFPDVPAGFWAGTAIAACVGNGVVRGYPDDYYHPEYTVTRDQMAVYVARAFGL